MNWDIQLHEFYYDDGELCTYAIAQCPNCKSFYHRKEALRLAESHFYLEHEENEPLPESVKEETRKLLKQRLNIKLSDNPHMNILPPYCEWCGQKLEYKGVKD